MSQPAVTLVADWERTDVAEVRDAVVASLESRADIVARVSADDDLAVPPQGVGCVVVVGGDGTIIRHLRRLAGRGIPVVGVNTGRLGFLAEFDADRFEVVADDALAGRLPVLEHRIAGFRVEPADGGAPIEGLAVNDTAVAAGEPFRMIELALEIDGREGVEFSGDGIVMATPTGSTAYTASAGGPIVHPGVDAMIITPVAAHGLAFRPIVVGGTARIRVRIVRANPGTSLVRDGQVVCGLSAGDVVEMQGGAATSQLVVDPGTSYWTILQDKLAWAVPPRYRH